MPNIVDLKKLNNRKKTLGAGAVGVAKNVGNATVETGLPRLYNAITNEQEILSSRPRLPEWLGKKWFIPAGIFVALIVIALSFIIFRKDTQTTEAAWFSDEWHYRKQFDVFNASTTEDLLDFQVELPTSTLALSTAWSAGKLRNDFKDLRFTDASGNLLDYWFPDATTTMGSVYIKMPTLPKNATSTVMMYYGNPSATDDRDGNKVFPDFFEDFSDGTYAAGPRLWTVTSGTYSVAGTDKYLQNDTAGIINTPSSKAYGVWGFSLYKANAANVPMVNFLSNGTPGGGYRFTVLANGSLRIDRINSDGSFSAVLISTAAGYISNNTWYRIKITRSTAGVFTVYIKGGIYGNTNWLAIDVTGGSGSNPFTNTTYTISTNLLNTFNALDRIDNILWRKFASTDPSVVATAGTSEEIGGGPIGYWNFDEGFGTTAYDRSGSGYHGTLTNMTTTGTSTAWTTGKVNKALQFDGVNDYVSTASNVNFNGKIATVSFWFYAARVFAYNTKILVESSTNFNSNDAFLITFNDSNGPVFGGFTVAMHSTGAPSYSALSTNSRFDDSKWHYVTVIFDRTQATFRQQTTVYVDTKVINTTQVGALNKVHTTNFPANRVFIGDRSGGAVAPFKGSLDEVKIYNYAPSVAQIKNEYNRGASVKLSISPNSEQDLYHGLVGYWKFDEATTTVNGTADNQRINDYSGLGNHGVSDGWTTGSDGLNSTTTAKFGNAGEFDGVSDPDMTYADGMVISGSPASLNLPLVRTIEAWINPRTLHLGTIVDGGTQYWLRIGVNGQLYYYYYNSSAWQVHATATSVISAGVWQHVVLVDDSSQPLPKIYVNGVEYKFTTTPTQRKSNTGTVSAFYIGKYGSQDPFNGMIDDVKLYALARTPEQIMNDYLTGPGPIASYNFEEKSGTTLNDISGSGYNGTITAGASKGFVKGKIGRAYDFDGANTRISSNVYSQLTGAFTISTWVKPDAKSGSAFYCLGASGADLPCIYLDYAGLNRPLIIWNTGNYRYFNTSAYTTLTNNQWHYVVFVITGLGQNDIANSAMYIDGVSQSVYSTTRTNAPLNFSSFTIGNRTGGGQSFDGRIDDLKVYNYVLTPWQIAQEYNQGKPIAQWSFDNGQGTTATNIYSASTTNPFNGTLTNMSTTGTSTAWVTGKFGKALLFDGTNDTVAVTDGTGSGMDITSAGSLSAWVKPTTVSGNKYIIDKVESTQYALLLSGAQVKGYFGNSSCSGGTAKANEWSYVTVAWDGAYIRCYLNGTQVGQTAYSTALTAHNTSLYIGSDGGAASWFSGIIDEPKIYQYALSPVQIKKDYNDGLAVALSTADGGRNSQNGLIGYWKMDEATTTWDGAGDRVNDYSGLGNHGTAAGSAHATTTAKYGNAAEFDGTDDYVEVPENSALRLISGGTISAWIYPRGYGGNGLGRILEKSRSGPNRNYDLNLTNTGQIQFDIKGSSTYTSASAISLNQWQYVSVVFTNQGRKIYVNGNDKTSTGAGEVTMPEDSSGVFRIGNSEATATREFNGVIDDVKVYTIARTPEQIMNDYLQGPGPIASYNFEEKSGTTVNDISGSGYNGTITAGASKGFVKGKIGRAYDFDGANTKIDTGSDWMGPTGISNQNISVSAWIYVKSYGEGSRGRIIDNGSFIVNVNVSGNANFGLTSNTSLYGRSSNNSIQLDTWYHIVATRALGATAPANFYVNGVLSGSADQSSATAGAIVGTSNVIIGNNNAQGYSFDGKIDDLKVFNYILTPWQIAQEYNGGGPIGYWKMDEGENKTVYDWSGNAYNGTLSLSGSPATSTAWAAESACKKGHCLDLDGTNDQVTVTDSTGSGLDVSVYASISAWIKPDTVTGSQYIVDKDQSTAYSLMISGTSLVGYFDVGGSNSCSGGIVKIGEWQYVSATYDGNYIHCYINGNEVGKTADTSGAIDVQNTSLYIGSDGGAASYFNGKIDEVKIYNYALSPAQIKEDYNMGAGVYFK
ncbi:MAG: DUF2341 domain-containing protein [Patescibacteria group bacterium]|jgi:hypothetical protein